MQMRKLCLLRYWVGVKTRFLSMKRERESYFNFENRLYIFLYCYCRRMEYGYMRNNGILYFTQYPVIFLL